MGSVNYSTPCQSAPTSGGSTYALGMIGDQYTAKTTSSSLFLFLTRSSLLATTTVIPPFLVWQHLRPSIMANELMST